MHLIVLRLAVAYRQAREFRDVPSIHDDDYILYPTDLLCGNLHGSFLAYYGLHAGLEKHLKRVATREIDIESKIDLEKMRNHLFRLRGRRGVIVGWQLN